jgi:rhamnogalacturonyl hydrolase YesR
MKKVSLKILMLLALTGMVASCNKSEFEEQQSELSNNRKQSALATRPINPVSNADAAYEGFLRAFLVRTGGRTYIVDGLNKRDKAYFWGQAFMITGLIDACERRPTAERKQLITDLINSFLAQETLDWSWNTWTDDIAWASIAMIRAYNVTGNTTYRTVAANNWNFAFNRGWDNTVGGGLWENMDKHTKASLANNPMIIAGIFLYEATGDVAYLNKCKQIYAWFRSSGIYDVNTGIVNEAKVNDGTIQYSDNAYNTGSFINAAASLYKHTRDSQYLNDAVRSADHVVNKFGVINQEADACVRGIAKLARENNMGSKYNPWLVRQCIASWNNRRTDYNITNNDWRNTTPGGEQFAMQCISAVTVQNVTPEAEMVEVPTGTFRIIARHNGLALDAVGGGTENNTALNVWGYNGGSNQRWTLVSLGNGIYRLTGAGSGRSLNVSGNSGENGANVILYDYQGSGNSKIYFSSPAPGYYTMYFVNSGKAVDVAGSTQGSRIVQWTPNGGNNQQWQFLAP